jgi:hypothetical protein
MATIAITYKAFQHNVREGREGVTTARFDFPLPTFKDTWILDMIYEATNLQDELVEFGGTPYGVLVWNEIKKVLPINRTHTSLSVGDEIQIDDRLYSIENVGFKLMADATNR